MQVYLRGIFKKIAASLKKNIELHKSIKLFYETNIWWEHLKIKQNSAKSFHMEMKKASTQQKWRRKLSKLENRECQPKFLCCNKLRLDLKRSKVSHSFLYAWKKRVSCRWRFLRFELKFSAFAGSMEVDSLLCKVT